MIELTAKPALAKARQHSSRERASAVVRGASFLRLDSCPEELPCAPGLPAIVTAPELEPSISLLLARPPTHPPTLSPCWSPDSVAALRPHGADKRERRAARCPEESACRRSAPARRNAPAGGGGRLRIMTKPARRKGEEPPLLRTVAREEDGGRVRRRPACRSHPVVILKHAGTKGTDPL